MTTNSTLLAIFQVINGKKISLPTCLLETAGLFGRSDTMAKTEIIYPKNVGYE
jgi:hypothetical protein